MSDQITQTALNRPALGIGMVLMAVFGLSINDMLIKQLSGGYPLHQMVFVRSLIGILFTTVLLKFEGGWSILATKTPGLHLLRGLLIVISNLTFFTALVAVPLAQATALFFVAPLFITVLSIPILGEKVSALRLGAVAIGFCGVMVMLQPWANVEARGVSIYVLFLPIIAAITYALNQILTRKLGAASKASAMAFYIQATFVVVSVVIYLIAGDGRYVDISQSDSIRFLLRAWEWPQGVDRYLFIGLGMNAAIIGYALTQAYRVTDAAVVAPFEYVGLPLAVIWGWIIWGEFPQSTIWIGIIMIMGSGLFVYLREWQNKRRLIKVKRLNNRF